MHHPNQCMRDVATLGKATGQQEVISKIADYANVRFKSYTRFQTSLADTTTGFGAFGYVPGKTTTLCGQCEDEKTREPQKCNLDASHNCPTESTKINGDGHERKHKDAGRDR